VQQKRAIDFFPPAAETQAPISRLITVDQWSRGPKGPGTFPQNQLLSFRLFLLKTFLCILDGTISSLSPSLFIFMTSLNQSVATEAIFESTMRWRSSAEIFAAKSGLVGVYSGPLTVDISAVSCTPKSLFDLGRCPVEQNIKNTPSEEMKVVTGTCL
jgi:hypothetical protein